MATGSVDQTAPDGRGKRSRREVLAGAAGVLGVLTAQTLGKFTPAHAGSDGDVVLGADNQSTAGTTGVQSSAITGLHGKTTNSGNSANTGVFGEGPTGVHGTGSSIGVQGDGATCLAGTSSSRPWMTGGSVENLTWCGGVKVSAGERRQLFRRRRQPWLLIDPKPYRG